MDPKINVLLIDDDEDAYVMTDYMLGDIKDHQFNLDWEASYDSALDAINRHEHDVYIVDYRLKGHDGLELLKEARDQGCKAPIILVTGQETNELDVQALRSGAADYLTKDEISGPQLERTIRHAIERKKAEQALAEEKELLAVTLRSIRDGVIVTDWTGRIILINRTAESLTLWSQAEAKGKPLSAVLRLTHPTTSQAYPDPVQTILSSQGMVEFEPYPVLVGARGKTRTLEMSGSTLRDHLRHSYGILFVFRDISEKIRMEKELLKTSKLESLGNLAGGIAHDFNNLLSAILGNIQLARMSLPTDHEVQTSLDRGETSCQRAQALTQEFLTFANGGKPVTRPIAISELVRRSALLAVSGLPIRCNFSIPSDTWMVDVDEAQISQAMNNIVINAAEAMPQGGVVNITIENEKLSSPTSIPLASGSYVKIAIADRGKGIEKSDLDKIFDPYFSTKPQGSGLGLTAAFYIIKNHGGAVTVDSQPHRGSIFTIYLPASSKTAEEPGDRNRRATRQTGTILVMDDEAIVRDTVKDVLRHQGYKVSVADDGSEAIKIYKRHMTERRPFDAVILDLTVPEGKGGLETVKELKTVDPQAKVLVASGYSNDPIMSRYREHGFCAVVLKPFDIDHLDNTLQDVLLEREAEKPRAKPASRAQ